MLTDEEIKALAERLAWTFHPHWNSWCDRLDNVMFYDDNRLTLAGVAACIEGLRLVVYPPRADYGWVITGWDAKNGGYAEADTLTEAVEAAVKEVV